VGGKAFLERGRRVGGEEYRDLSHRVIEFLSSVGCRADLIPSYKKKRDHGDIDILVTGGAGQMGELGRNISLMEGYSRHLINGECLSFLCRGVQVDLIVVPEADWEMGMTYFSWNDLGNLMGRVARKTGFRYGHRGLFLEAKDHMGNIVKKLTISRDPAKIFSFLGYDISRWRRGFDELSDIFEFVASSTFFSKECFLLGKLDHGTRTRNKKRKVYLEFLRWLEQIEDSGFDFQQTSTEWWRGRAAVFFEKDWIGEEARLREEAELRSQRKDRFNGRVIRQWTGLEGEELGLFIKNFKEAFGDSYEQWVGSLEREHIVEVFRGTEGGEGESPAEWGRRCGQKAFSQIIPR
jgi:hypothetical protein